MLNLKELLSAVEQTAGGKGKAYEMLAKSSGESISGVKKRFYIGQNKRPCSWAVWRCWSRDFLGVDPGDKPC